MRDRGGGARRVIGLALAILSIVAVAPASSDGGGTVSTVVGTGEWGFSGDGGRASSARIAVPADLTFDADGSLYFSDLDNHRVRKVDPSGKISTIAGTGSLGYDEDGVPARSTRLYYPRGVAASSDSVYIADTYNHRVRRVGPDGIITTVAGSGQCTQPPDPDGDGLAAVDASLCFPADVEVAANGDVFIADTFHNTIRVVDATGVIRTVAGRLRAASDDVNRYSGDGGPATQANLNKPAGLALDSLGRLYIADTYNNRVRVVSGGMIHSIAGNGLWPVPGYTYAPPFLPWQVAGDNARADQAFLFMPIGIDLDEQGNLYIADNAAHRVRRVRASDGVIETIAGTGWKGFSGDGGPANVASVYLPFGLRIDPFGDLYVLDSFNNRIRRVRAPFTGYADPLPPPPPPPL